MDEENETAADIRKRSQQQAKRTHGIYAFQDRGEESLEPANIGRLAELRRLVKTYRGRQELRQELFARTMLICDIAYGELRTTSEQGISIMENPVIRIASTWYALANRILDSFPEEDREGLSSDIIQQALDHEQDAT